MSEKRQTIVLIPNYWDGYMQSLAWLVALGAAIGFAVWVDSQAMQWVMGAVWLLTLIGWASGQTKRLTIDEAYERISKLKAERDEAAADPSEAVS